MSPKLKNILLNNWTLSFILGFILILFVNPVKNKFFTKLVSVETVLKHGNREYYDDLNFDGNSERIVFETNQAGNGSVKIYNPNHLGQYYALNRPILNFLQLFISDTDADSFKEIYFPGIRKDSIFMNKIDFARLTHAEEYFIEKVTPDTPESDIVVNYIKSVDLNNDRIKEIIFSINVGYNLQPRKIYALDLVNGNILKTPLTGAKVDPEIIDDIDGDGFPEIICGTFASGNYEKSPVPYSDTSSWVMIFDHNLQFKTKPVYIFNEKTTTDVRIIKSENSKYLLAFLNIKNKVKLSPKYLIIDPSGNVIHSDSIGLDEFPTREYGMNDIFQQKQNSTDFLMISFNGNLFKINNLFQFEKAGRIDNFFYPQFVATLDLTGDGKDEQIFQKGASDEFLFIDPTVKHISRVQISGRESGMKHYGTIEKKGKSPLFYYQTGDKIFTISYKQNPFWNFRFIFWAIILAGIYLILWALQYIQKQRIKAQLNTQQKMREMQFKIITSQLNPHFLFNALNSISSSLFDKNNTELYDRFVKFSRLVRFTLIDADKVARTLEDEYKFTIDFLEIQLFRFKGLFSYSIKVDDGVDKNMLVPKMIIQLFVENAVKHGFSTLKEKGLLKIEAVQEEGFLRIQISDNGIGRKNAASTKNKNTESTGLGIKTMMEYIELLNKINHNKISISITDLFNDKNIPGTLVEINIPIKFNYDISV